MRTTPEARAVARNSGPWALCYGSPLKFMFLLNCSKNEKNRNARATHYRVDVAIELEPLNAITGFIERLKENDVRQMSHHRNRILQRLWTK